MTLKFDGRPWAAFRESDPLGHGATTWLFKDVGPECRVCGIGLVRGHRYYVEEQEVETSHMIVVHYSCLAGEEAAARESEAEEDEGRLEEAATDELDQDCGCGAELEGALSAGKHSVRAHYDYEVSQAELSGPEDEPPAGPAWKAMF